MAKHRCAPARRPGRLTALALSTGLGLAGLATASLAAAPPARAAARDIVEVGPAQRQADAQVMLEEINRYRAAHGAPPVRYSATLSRIVQQESDRQVAAEQFSHGTAFLTDPRTGPYTKANEVIALEHHRDVRALVTWWTTSAAHDKAIKDPRHQVIGIGLTYADGRLESTGKPWQVLATVNLYEYARGGAPADAADRVGAGPAALAPTSGGHAVGGAIGEHWARLGGRTVLGEPITPERCGLAGGGCYQEFALAGRTTTVYWAPGLGPHAVANHGAIGQAWIAAGREHGYGYPVTDEVRAGAEVQQRFASGHVLHWSPATGATWATR